MFENYPLAPPDPILGLSEAFQKDTRSDKVNLSVGVFKDDLGATPVLASVKEAESRLWTTESSKNYLSIEGHTSYLSSVKKLLLGNAIDHARVAAIQSCGGTGALRVIAETIADQVGQPRIWVSQPTWTNHHAIFKSAGAQVELYPYLAKNEISLDFQGMIDSLANQAKAGDLVCLHACCHNPTGVDLSLDQWRELAGLLAEKRLIPFFDFAYQGFGDGLQADTSGLHAVLQLNPEAVICASFSKNFGLYSERVGAGLVVTRDAKSSTSVLSQLKQCIRSNYSNPPRHGAAIVATILGDDQLRAQWEAEVTAMRNRICSMRSLFVETMQRTCPQRDFSFLLSQKGMFSYTGLTAMQADWLRTERAIYILSTGRINVAGMSADSMDHLCQAIAECLEATSPAITT